MNKFISRIFGTLTLVAAAGAMVVPTVVFADTLNLGTFAQGLNAQTLVLSNATIQSSTLNTYIGAANIGNEVCAWVDNSCTGDMTISFNSAVKGLSFFTSGYDIGDSILVTAYSGINRLGTINKASDGRVDLSSSTFDNLTKIYIANSSAGAGAGMAYDHFNFITAVPEPETYALMLAGLGLLNIVARRRKSKFAAV